MAAAPAGLARRPPHAAGTFRPERAGRSGQRREDLGEPREGLRDPGGPPRTWRIPMDSTEGPPRKPTNTPAADTRSAGAPAATRAQRAGRAGEGTGRRGCGPNTWHCVRRSWGAARKHARPGAGLTPVTSGRRVWTVPAWTAPAWTAPPKAPKPGRPEHQQRGAGRSLEPGQATRGHRVSGRPSAALPGQRAGRAPPPPRGDTRETGRRELPEAGGR